mgnify:CR=1 FL=1
MTKGDRWLLLLLVVVGFSLLAWKALSYPSSAQQVQVFRDGEVILSFTLNSSAEIRTYQLTVDGGVATLEAKDGAVRLAPTSAHYCPERICMQTGWINQPGASIICVPNKLVVRIKTMEDGVDAISR